MYEAQQAEEEEKKKKEAEARTKAAKMAEKSLGGICGVAKALENANGEKPAAVEGGGLALAVGKKKPGDPAESMKSGSTGIDMPDLGSIGTDVGKGGVGTTMVASKDNPYQSANSGSSVQGGIVSLKLTDEFGNEIPVTNSSKPFVISLAVPEPAPFVEASVKLLESTLHKVI